MDSQVVECEILWYSMKNPSLPWNHEMQETMMKASTMKTEMEKERRHNFIVVHQLLWKRGMREKAQAMGK